MKESTARLEAFSDGVFAIAITGTFIVVGLSRWLLFQTMVSRGLIAEDVDVETIARIRRANFFGPLVYVVATGVALYNAVAGLVLNTSLWLVWTRLCYRNMDDRHERMRRRSQG